MAGAALPDRNYLLSVFQKVDKDRSGAIDAAELQVALSNGMFDKGNKNVISFEDFIHLWKYVTDWQGVFRSFDRDNSNNISKDELRNCLTSFGYRFSENFFGILMQKFDRTKKGVIYFDDFIKCCLVLQMLTQVFAAHDVERRGVITVSYEQFLCMIFSTNL
ncbi:EF-hand domain [Trinorchestia longiramus]|nr:EF-hand domain [Trinorchestia longiramus]